MKIHASPAGSECITLVYIACRAFERPREDAISIYMCMINVGIVSEVRSPRGLSEELVKVFSRPISELLTRLTCLVMAVVVE